MKKIVLLHLYFLGIVHLSLAQRNTPAGAAFPFPQNKTYAYGMQPSNVNIADVISAYDFWRSNYTENCNGSWRVKADDPNYTFSEGIGYGMLLSAYAADKILFDGLWAYYKKFKDSNGLMNWKVQGCNSLNQTGAASDADLDAAVGLYIADKQWGSKGLINYLADCKTLANTILTYEVNPNSWNLFNGNTWGINSECFNPGYFSPAYYKLFKNISGNANWDKVYARAYTVLNANSNSVTGLVSNWCDANGNAGTCNGPLEYGWDACRNPWRLAIDVLWNGSPAGMSILNKQTAFWQSKGASQVSGPMPLGGGSGLYHTGAFIATWGAGAMGCTRNFANQSHVNAMYTENVNNPPTATGSYFSGTLRVLGLFVQSGNFYLPETVVTSDENDFSELELPALFPNPAKDKIVLNLSSLQGPAAIEIRDFMGSVRIKTTLLHEEMVSDKAISLAGLGSGLYILNIKANSNSWIKRFVKE